MVPNLDKFRFNKKSFSFKGNIEKEITRNASVIITDEDQIKLAERIEKWINESESIAQDLGVKSIPMSLVRVLPVLFYKDLQVRIHPKRFMQFTAKN